MNVVSSELVVVDGGKSTPLHTSWITGNTEAEIRVRFYVCQPSSKIVVNVHSVAETVTKGRAPSMTPWDGQLAHVNIPVVTVWIHAIACLLKGSPG